MPNPSPADTSANTPATQTETSPPQSTGDPWAGYWKANLSAITVLLLVWAFITYGIAYLAPSIHLAWQGWELPFWIGAQGAPLLYILSIAFYATYMRRLDQRHRSPPSQHDTDPSSPIPPP